MEEWKENYDEAAIAFTDENYPLAIEFADKAIEGKCENIDIYSLRGMSYYYLKMHDKALPDFNHYLKIKDTDYLVIANRGNSYTMLGQYEKALKDHNRFIQSQPENGAGYQNRAYCYFMSKKYYEAAVDFDKAESLGSPNYAIYFYRGYSLFHMNYFDGALRDLNKAVEIDEQPFEPYLIMGNIRYEMGQYEEAIAHFSHAIYLHDNDADIYYKRMHAYMQAKKYPQAETDANRVLKLDAGYFHAEKDGINLPVTSIKVDEKGTMNLMVDTAGLKEKDKK
jgi:tetratricopeptide (TPR) repeat protein